MTVQTSVISGAGGVESAPPHGLPAARGIARLRLDFSANFVGAAGMRTLPPGKPKEHIANMEQIEYKGLSVGYGGEGARGPLSGLRIPVIRSGEHGPGSTAFG